MYSFQHSCYKGSNKTEPFLKGPNLAFWYCKLQTMQEAPVSRGQLGHELPPLSLSLSSRSGTARGQPISLFCKKQFSARIPICIIMLIELCNDNANSSRTFLLLTVRRQHVNLIILPLVLCIVPRVTSCSFWVKKYWRSGEGKWFNPQLNYPVLRYGEAFVVHCDSICSALKSVQ